MRNRLALLLAAGVAIGVLRCGSCLAAAPAKLVILPIGDSITELGNYKQNWRYWLGLHLQSNSIPYDYVGSKTGVRKSAPPPTGDDMDHESYWGWRIDQVMGPAIASAKKFKPDIAIIHLGSNDIFKNQGVANAVADMKTLIAGVREGNPNVKIFLAMISYTPFPDHKQGKYKPAAIIEELNQAYIALAKELSTDESPVYHVEMRENGKFDTLTLTGDGTHPSIEGGPYLARKWFEALQEHVLGPAAKPVDLKTAELASKADRESRTWTSTSGSTLESGLIRMSSGVAYFKREGKTIKIPVNKLSEADQLYLKQLVQKERKAK